MPDPSHDESIQNSSTSFGRRALVAALGGTLAYVAIPHRWSQPLMTWGVLPAHAAGSGTVAPSDAGMAANDAAAPITDAGAEASAPLCATPATVTLVRTSDAAYATHDGYISFEESGECAIYTTPSPPPDVVILADDYEGFRFQAGAGVVLGNPSLGYLSGDTIYMSTTHYGQRAEFTATKTADAGAPDAGDRRSWRVAVRVTANNDAGPQTATLLDVDYTP